MSDIILGTPFLTYAKAIVEHDPTQAVLFPGNQRWHSLNVFPVVASPDLTTPSNIQLVGASEAHQFMKRFRKEVQVYQVTVGELQDIVTASDSTQKAGGHFNGDPAVVELVERYRIRMFSDRVPTNRPRPNPNMPKCGNEDTVKGGSYPC